MEVPRARLSEGQDRKGRLALPSLTPALGSLRRGFFADYFRQIDKHTLHYLTPPNTALLSPSEVTYATRHQALLHTHYLSSFLASFPPSLQNLNDAAGGVNMVDKPDADTAVFVRILKRGVVVEGRGRNEDGRMDAERGDVVVARWGDMKELIGNGEVELI